MKTLKLIALVALAFAFSQCKSPTQVMQSSPMLSEVPKILVATNSTFFQFANQTNGNPQQAIMLTADWVRSQSNVQSVDVLDSTYIRIVMKSGLATTYYLNEVDANGLSLLRGGGKQVSGGKMHLSGMNSQNTIENKKVLIYAAGYSQFYTPGEIEAVVTTMNNAHLGLEVSLLTDGQCSPETIDSFMTYGLVIMDTHGTPDAFLTGGSVAIANAALSEDDLKKVIVSNGNTDTYNKLLSGQLAINYGPEVKTFAPNWQKDSLLRGTFSIWATSKYIEGLPPMPNTIVFGNMCYSGNRVTAGPTGNVPIRSAFIKKNLLAYYGYAYSDGTSAPVGNGFAKIMEDTVVNALMVGFDSTGDACLREDGTEFSQKVKGKPLYLELSNADDYSYEKCVDSVVDPRDQHVYKTVCIGKQTWMAENLDYDPSSPGNACYNGDPANCKTYGMLYDWTTMMQGQSASTANPSGVRGICPQGWHLPSESEYMQLINAVGGIANGGSGLRGSSWQKDTGTVNTSGFNLLPGGYTFSVGTSGTYLGLGTTATLSSCTLNQQTGRNFGLIIFSSNASVSFDAGHDPNSKDANSCRCVKDP
jgi:uncharacterized protein (TIGR02145 family)